MKKSDILNALDTLQEEDVTINDVVERLILVEKVKRSIKSADKGNTVSHEEAKRRVTGLWQG